MLQKSALNCRILSLYHSLGASQARTALYSSRKELSSPSLLPACTASMLLGRQPMSVPAHSAPPGHRVGALPQGSAVHRMCPVERCA